MACSKIKPFTPDEHTVALYHFDEGAGNEAHDACGDSELTLHCGNPIWAQGPDGRSVAQFVRRKDDAHLFIGPADNDKLHLRRCTEVWTVEAQIRYTGPIGEDLGATYANICGTDDEGFSLPEGIRGGWTFALLTSEHDKGLIPWARFIGARGRKKASIQTAARISPVSENYHGESQTSITDQQWHHVAWQFRYADQQHFLFLDGRLIWKFQRPRSGMIVNDFSGVCIPFTVGGLIHSQDPPFYLGHGNFGGDICELRLSKVMRYPVTDRLSIVRTELPNATLGDKYSQSLTVDAAKGPVRWFLTEGTLPKGLVLDEKRGVIAGQAEEYADRTDVIIRATDDNDTDEYPFSLSVRKGEIIDNALPLAFVGLDYRHELTAVHLVNPVRWSIVSGQLPEGFTLDEKTGVLSGVPAAESIVDIRIQAADAIGQTVLKDFVLRTVPKCLRRIGPDEHTVVLYDWQGLSGKFICDVMGDPELTLTWVNMIGDQRLERKEWGVYPRFPGGGEYGFVGPQNNDKLDLKTCSEEWTVEAWVRRGGSVNNYDQPFDFGHICGTFDTTKRGVWELYLAYDGSPNGSMAPGVHFVDADGGLELTDLHPWRKPEGIVLEKLPGGRLKDRQLIGIVDTEWHHVAWQYSSTHDRHQLFLDGLKIWEMTSPGGKKLINNRVHNAQFSIGSRLNGYAKYGGKFNWLGWGNFFGQIGEIRISDVCRY